MPIRMVNLPVFLCALLLAGLCWCQDEATAKIYGGMDASGSGHPWLVRIEKSNGTICHGSLIDKMWILTLASCVETDTARNLRIVIGDEHREVPDGEHTNRGSLVVKHKKYTTGSADYDIALVRLKRPANTDRKWIMVVPKLASPRAENAALTNENIKCRIAGWGQDLKNDKWKYTGKLQQRFVRFHEAGTCESISDFNTVTQLCYKGTPCTGDEGTPVICYIQKTWIQVGMHARQGPDDDCIMGERVSMSVAYFKRWIKNAIRRN